MASTDEILRRLAMRLDAIDAKLDAILKRTPTATAARMRRYRERNAQRNGSHREKRNSSVTKEVPINGNAVAYIPLISGAEFGVSKELLQELETAYPAVDGPATLLEIRAWCVTNPTKRKTARGVPRFLNRWFEKVQNGG